jgi:hypothetical protein
MCPEVNQIVTNILLAVSDEAATTYSSGSVGNFVYKSLPVINGIMGICLSGTTVSGVFDCITPSVSGTIVQGILELYVAKELTKKSLYSSARSFNLTSFQEGDSKVTVSSAASTLDSLYKSLSEDFDKMVKYAKYTLASQSPFGINGTDASIENYRGYNTNYYPKI